MLRVPLLPALFCAMLVAGPTWAQSTPPADDDGWSDDSDDDGFGDDASEDEDESFDIDADIDDEVEGPSPLSLRGFLRSDWHLWTERFDGNPWAKGRQNLDLIFTAKYKFLQFKAELHGEYDFAYLHERGSYDSPTLREYEFQVLTRDVFLAFSLGAAELTIGRQIVTWGEGDALSPLDVVNPRDLREPGLADLDDIRLPLLATRLGIFIGDHRIEAMVVHEFSYGLRSPPFGPFSPFESILASDPLAAAFLGGFSTIDFNDLQPQFGLETQQPFLRWVYKGPSVDVGLYAAYTLDKGGVVTQGRIDGDSLFLDLDHQYYGVIGHSGAAGVDAFLFKWEVGVQLDRLFNTGSIDAAAAGAAIAAGENSIPFPATRESLFDVMIGVTYTPISDLVFGLEFAKSTFFDKPDGLLFPVDQEQLAFRVSYTTLKERLQLSGAVSFIGFDPKFDVLARAEISYNVVDTFDIGLGYVLFFPGEDTSFISGFDNHDRLFLKFRWDFTIL